jgi:hypothetical protein
MARYHLNEQDIFSKSRFEGPRFEKPGTGLDVHDLVFTVTPEGHPTMHIETQPNFSEEFIEATGKSRKELLDSYAIHLGKRVTTSLNKTASQYGWSVDDTSPTLADLTTEGKLSGKVLSFKVNGLNLRGTDRYSCNEFKNGVGWLVTGDNSIRYMSGSALDDLVGDIPCKEIKKSHHLRSLAGLDDGIHSLLTKHPEINSELQKKLSDIGIEEVQNLGNGKTGSFFKSSDGRVVAVRQFNLNRNQTPFELQSITNFSCGNKLHVDVTPLLDNSVTTHNDMERLSIALGSWVGPKGERYYPDDFTLRNIGRANDGTPFVLDGDAVVCYKDPTTAPDHVKAFWKECDKDIKAGRPPDLRTWINEDGTSRQHDLFKKHHEKANSALYKNGGKLPGQIIDASGASVHPKTITTNDTVVKKPISTAGSDIIPSGSGSTSEQPISGKREPLAKPTVHEPHTTPPKINHLPEPHIPIKNPPVSSTINAVESTFLHAHGGKLAAGAAAAALLAAGVYYVTHDKETDDDRKERMADKVRTTKPKTGFERQ